MTTALILTILVTTYDGVTSEGFLMENKELVAQTFFFNSTAETKNMKMFPLIEPCRSPCSLSRTDGTRIIGGRFAPPNILTVPKYPLFFITIVNFTKLIELVHKTSVQPLPGDKDSAHRTTLTDGHNRPRVFWEKDIQQDLKTSKHCELGDALTVIFLLTHHI